MTAATESDLRAQQSDVGWLREIAITFDSPSGAETVRARFAAIADALEAKDAEIARLKNSTTQARYAELEQARNHYFQQLAATRAERDALAALVKVARCPNNNCEDGIIPTADGYGGWQQIQCQWCDERAKALRAGQQKG